MPSSMPDIVVLSPGNHGMGIEGLESAIESRLPNHEVAVAVTPDQKRTLLESARFAVGITIEEEYIEHAEHLELFASTYAGTGHVPAAPLEANDVAVTSASGVHGPNIAEYVIGAILSYTRRFNEARRRQRRHEWRHFQADEFQGSTVMVVGLGAIGIAIVDRLIGFGVETIGVRYTPEKDGPTDSVIGFEAGDFHDALARTNVLILACPLTDETRGLIGYEELVTLPPDALLINIARGPIVDTTALVEVIRSNQIGGAVLDVTDPEPLPPDHPLWDFGNVMITPHNAGHTPEYFERVAEIFADNVGRIERGETELRNRVS